MIPTLESVEEIFTLVIQMYAKTTFSLTVHEILILSVPVGIRWTSILMLSVGWSDGEGSASKQLIVFTKKY